jgi:hypothetical protein
MLERMGRKFARIAVVDASLIKLSLLAYSWAEYHKQGGAAKMHAVLECAMLDDICSLANWTLKGF